MSRAGRTNLLLILRLLGSRNLDFLSEMTSLFCPMFCLNREFLNSFFAQVLPLRNCWVALRSLCKILSKRGRCSLSGIPPGCGLVSFYIRLYCFRVELAPIPALRLRRSLQGMRRDHPRPGRNHAQQLDCCRLSVVWVAEALPADRDFPGNSVAATVYQPRHTEVCPWVK